MIGASANNCSRPRGRKEVRVKSPGDTKQVPVWACSLVQLKVLSFLSAPYYSSGVIEQTNTALLLSAWWAFIASLATSVLIHRNAFFRGRFPLTEIMSERHVADAYTPDSNRPDIPFSAILDLPKSRRETEM